MRDKKSITPRLLKPSEASEYLAVSERTLWQLTKDNTIPAVRMRRAVRYDLADLDAFIDRSKEAAL